jgi:hypothetical protein
MFSIANHAANTGKPGMWVTFTARSRYWHRPPKAKFFQQRAISPSG